LPVCLKRYKDVGRLYLVLFGKFDNNRIGEQRGVIGAEGRIAGNDNAFVTAELNKLLLRARTMIIEFIVYHGQHFFTYG